jgi:proline iminopeptidase
MAASGCAGPGASARAPAPSREGYAVNGGVRIWYRVEGGGIPGAIPLLLIHGGPGATARPFERTIGPVFAKDRPVVYMDYRGAGRSDRPASPAQYSFEILASDAEAVRAQLGIERWAVFGHSNGGATAITYARRHPERVSALVLCDPLLSSADLEMNMIHKVALAPADKFLAARTIYKSSETREVRFDRLLDLLDQETRYRFQFHDPRDAAVLARIQAELSTELGKDLMEPALMRGLAASGFFEFDAYSVSPQLTMPALLVLGRYDSEISIDNAMRFALTLPDGYVALMEQSGHHPYLEEPSATAERVHEFLKDRRAPSP